MKGGHYIGWVKNKGKWFKCDDDKVSAVTKQTIRQLKGGSEAQSVYLCFYRYVDSNLGGLFICLFEMGVWKEGREWD